MRHTVRLLGLGSFFVAVLLLTNSVPFSPTAIAASDSPRALHGRTRSSVRPLSSSGKLNCEEKAICADTWEYLNYEGEYVGHDEPSVQAGAAEIDWYAVTPRTRSGPPS